MLAGAAATLVVAVGGTVADFAAAADLVWVVLGAGLAGGLVTGALSGRAGHVPAGARAGAYGGVLAFLGFVAVGAGQAVASGDFALLYLGFQSLLIALLVVPLHALSGALAAAVGVRLRRAAGGRTAL